MLELAPDRLALYSYAHVTWLAKQQRGFEKHDLPEPASKLRIFLSAVRRFLEAGYRYIGLDHFAKPEDELSQALADRTLRRNFMGHTTQAGVDLLGFGPSAISELRGGYAQSFRDLERWERGGARAAASRPCAGTPSRADDLERRWIIGRILCHGELRAAEFEAEFGGVFRERFARELASLAPAVADGLLELRAGREPAADAARPPAGAKRGDGLRRLSPRAAARGAADLQPDGLMATADVGAVVVGAGIAGLAAGARAPGEPARGLS